MQCVDAETLAAWADGGLPKGEAAAVESHLADCERCTAMLATFVRTTPDAPAAEPLWHKWHLMARPGGDRGNRGRTLGTDPRLRLPTGPDIGCAGDTGT